MPYAREHQGRIFEIEDLPTVIAHDGKIIAGGYGGRYYVMSPELAAEIGRLLISGAEEARRGQDRTISQGSEGLGAERDMH